jgi:uncharacterized damage-inducible protein DinB
MDIKEWFLKQKEAHRKRTREVLALVKPAMMEWRPEREALSVGEMLQHLWVSEEGVRRVALDGNFAYYEKRIPQGLRAMLGQQQGLEEELANLERVHAATLAAVQAFPTERFEEERVHDGLGFRRKVQVILLGINDHEIHHRAQLMVYMRMLGSPVAEAINRR